MKKILAFVIVIIIAGAVIWKFNGPSITSPVVSGGENTTENTPPVPTSQTIPVSTKLSEYKNDELGFSVKYPTAWEKSEAPSNLTLAIPVSASKDKNSIGKLEVKVDIVSGKCAFPPVTTVKERSNLTVGDLTLNMISISNTVQGRNYFNRMYSLQNNSICYLFTYSSIVLTPASKGFKGDDVKLVSTNNTKLVDEADTQFKDMVKTFKFVTGPAGTDETKASPKK
jgi:hypothetical protein